MSGPSPTLPRPAAPDGLVLEPFRGLRYAVDPPAAVTSPPYDVLDAAGVAALEQLSEHNVVRLILPRDEAVEGDRYAGAARRLAQWRAEGVLVADDEPALYVYEQSSPTWVQRGLVGALRLTPPEDGIVLPHESTMAGPVADRLALYTATEADLEPIFLVYSGGGAASDAVAGVSGEPLVDAVLGDGLRHRLWALTDADVLAAVAADLHGRTATIADGHHRYATYLARQAASPPGAADLGLAFLVDTSSFGPEVHPIHRVVPDVEAFELARRSVGSIEVHDLDGDDLAAGLEALEQAGPASFLLVSGDGGTLRLLTRPADSLADSLPPDRSAAWRGLDVTVLHEWLVPQVWRLVDTVDAVLFEHSVDDAVATASRTGGTAVLLRPTPVEAVAAVAAAGERMPRKSTLFTPKPRTGLLLRAFADHP